MSRNAAFFAVSWLAASCVSGHGPPSPLDGGRDVPGSPLVFVVQGLSFAFCHCHHGCGPGLDGTVQFAVSNSTDAPVALDVTAVTLDPTTGGAVLSAPAQGNIFVARTTGGAFGGVVAANSTETLTVAVYIDLPDPLPLGSYRIEVDFTEDGTPMRFPTGPVDIQMPMTVDVIRRGACE